MKDVQCKQLTLQYVIIQGINSGCGKSIAIVHAQGSDSESPSGHTRE